MNDYDCISPGTWMSGERLAPDTKFDHEYWARGMSAKLMEMRVWLVGGMGSRPTFFWRHATSRIPLDSPLGMD